MGRPNRFSTFLSASAAFLGAADLAWAQTSTQSETDAAEEVEEVEEIVVIAERGDDTRIDRRVYTLRDDPISQSSTMLDVLARLPSVTVAPSGAVRLLGSDKVTIQVDGQVVPGQSLDAILRSLAGSDIEKIEVVTNPSAQFSAQGEGGVINIVTKSRFRIGVSGSVQASGDSLGGHQFNASPTWSREAWSFGLRMGASRNKWSGDSERVREEFASGALTTDLSHWDGLSEGVYGGGVVTYRPNDRRRMSLNLFGVDFDSDHETTVARSNSDGPVFDQTLRNTGTFQHGRASFDLEQKGETDGEVLRFNATLSMFDNNDGTIVDVGYADGSPRQRYLTPDADSTRTANAKLDYERPLGEGQLLAFGGFVEQSDQDIDAALETVTGAPVAPDFFSPLDGAQTTNAAYGTYQFKAGNWTLLPGLRLEHYRREVRSPDGQSDKAEVDYFPSLHVRRSLADNLDLDLSYSRRISRPEFGQLSPAVRYSEAARGSSGNPDLAPTTTNAFEANLVFQDSARTYNVTFYDRISDGIISQISETRGDGVLITKPVNAGQSEQRGVQIIARAPVSQHWRYSVSANLLNRAFNVLQDGATVRRSELEYSGNAQLEYRDSNQSEAGADHFQFEVQFQGPQFYLQGERDDFVLANMTWRRRLTDRVSSVVTVQDVFDSRTNNNTLRTDTFYERSEGVFAGTVYRLALTYQFGSAQSAPPDAASGPSMGGGPP